MKKLLVILGLSLGLFAQTPESYNKCIGCHGVNGEKKALNKSKVLKDMTQEEIKTSLLGYKDNTYGGALKGVMVGQVGMLSEDDINNISLSLGKDINQTKGKI